MNLLKEQPVVQVVSGLLESKVTLQINIINIVLFLVASLCIIMTFMIHNMNYTIYDL